MITAGIDIGSRASKCVILQDNKQVIGTGIILTQVRNKESGQQVFDKACAAAGISPSQVEFVLATGYGRISVPFADKKTTEITCHGKGVAFLTPTVRTVIDIGGQDSKVISLSETGEVSDFVMNDRCAAGTGRFLEVMGRALELEISEFGEFHFKSKKPSAISSTCAVFAESEVISLLAEGALREDIIRGLHQSIANRIHNLANRLGVEPELAFTGGVAKNKGVLSAMEEAIGHKFADLHFDPQLIGALGASSLACKHLAKKAKRAAGA